MDPLTIRYATDDDAGLLASLGAATFAETFAADNTPEDMAAYLRGAFSPVIQAAELAEPSSCFLIAEVAGQPVGYARLREGRPPVGLEAHRPLEIVRLYAGAHWIGHGVGAALMKAGLRDTVARGCDALWLGVWERNARAIAFYRKWRFAEIGRQVFRLGDDAQTDFVMARPVAVAGSVWCPLRIETARLVLRQPHADDAAAIVARYAGDQDVTRFLGWPRHDSVDHTRAFLAFSDSEWERWPGGPYLVESRVDGHLLGSTGLAFQAADEAITGYVLAADAWGKGYATEVLRALTAIAARVGVRRLRALCHPDHGPSRHVLEKCGFVADDPPTELVEFPNLAPGVLQPALRYVRALDAASA